MPPSPTFRPRRRPTPIAVVAALVVVAGVLLLVSRRPAHRHLAATTTTTGLAVLPGAPGSVVTVPPDTTTLGFAGPAPTSAARPVPPTTVAGQTACAAGDLQTVTATDRGTYPSGATVTVTVTVTNIANRPCRLDQSTPATAGPPISIRRVATVVWQPAPAQSGAVVSSPRLLAPNASYQWATIAWNQTECVAPCSGGGPPVGPGSYLAGADNPPGASAPAAFTITP